MIPTPTTTPISLPTLRRRQRSPPPPLRSPTLPPLLENSCLLA